MTSQEKNKIKTTDLWEGDTSTFVNSVIDKVESLERSKVVSMAPRKDSRNRLKSIIFITALATAAAILLTLNLSSDSTTEDAYQIISEVVLDDNFYEDEYITFNF